MKFVAVTACPTGIAHTHMAAEALRHEAMLGGHEIVIETQGSEGPGGVLDPDDIAAADAVIVAADIHVDGRRFAGKPLVATSTAHAIRRTSEVIDRAVAAAETGDTAPAPAAEAAEPAAPEAAPPEAPAEEAAPAQAGGPRRFVAITSCPTGIAHTFMAAEGLRKAAED